MWHNFLVMLISHTIKIKFTGKLKSFLLNTLPAKPLPRSQRKWLLSVWCIFFLMYPFSATYVLNIYSVPGNIPETVVHLCYSGVRKSI